MSQFVITTPGGRVLKRFDPLHREPDPEPEQTEPVTPPRSNAIAETPTKRKRKAKGRTNAKRPPVDAAEALARAQSGQSLVNYPGIFDGFTAKGIPADQILPRENVFTYGAWLALGRQVRKGEHGVKVVTRIVQTKEKTDPETGEVQVKAWSRPWTGTVFHISQTDPVSTATAPRADFAPSLPPPEPTPAPVVLPPLPRTDFTVPAPAATPAVPAWRLRLAARLAQAA